MSFTIEVSKTLNHPLNINNNLKMDNFYRWDNFIVYFKHYGIETDIKQFGIDTDTDSKYKN